MSTGQLVEIGGKIGRNLISGGGIQNLRQSLQDDPDWVTTQGIIASVSGGLSYLQHLFAPTSNAPSVPNSTSAKTNNSVSLPSRFANIPPTSTTSLKTASQTLPLISNTPSISTSPSTPTLRTTPAPPNTVSITTNSVPTPPGFNSPQGPAQPSPPPSSGSNPLPPSTNSQPTNSLTANNGNDKGLSNSGSSSSKDNDDKTTSSSSNTGSTTTNSKSSENPSFSELGMDPVIKRIPKFIDPTPFLNTYGDRGRTQIGGYSEGNYQTFNSLIPGSNIATGKSPDGHFTFKIKHNSNGGKTYESTSNYTRDELKQSENSSAVEVPPILATHLNNKDFVNAVKEASSMLATNPNVNKLKKLGFIGKEAPTYDPVTKMYHLKMSRPLSTANKAEWQANLDLYMKNLKGGTEQAAPGSEVSIHKYPLGSNYKYSVTVTPDNHISVENYYTVPDSGSAPQ